MNLSGIPTNIMHDVLNASIGLTAGLPIVLPSNQNYVDPASLDRGDTAWLMISTVFGLFISPALGYFYSTQNLSLSFIYIELKMIILTLIQVANAISPPLSWCNW